ncbi:hypothetical protein [Paenibacillus sp. SYP-B4298]|uniref:hypothetical protein n=1 Tax=Paenibacillus sp. SYP-B4298 TaxID=2996034 RepID=UPI0022DCE463|nr:hypothetical protein [Paenibacillus sp. SYP-B4298]
MRRFLALTINYNLNYIFNRFVIFLVWSVILGSFYLLVIDHGSSLSWVDAVLDALGRRSVQDMTILQLFIAMSPYMMIGLITELYSSHLLGAPAVQMLMRVRNTRIYLASAITILLLVTILFIVLYTGSLFMLSYWLTPSTEKLAVGKFMSVLLVQIIGAYTQTMLQLVITQWSGRFRIGFLCIIILMLFQVVFPQLAFPLGAQIFIGQIDFFSSNPDAIPIGQFVILHVLLCITAVVALLKKKAFIIWERTK